MSDCVSTSIEDCVLFTRSVLACDLLDDLDALDGLLAVEYSQTSAPDMLSTGTVKVYPVDAVIVVAESETERVRPERSS